MSKLDSSPVKEIPKTLQIESCKNDSTNLETCHTCFLVPKNSSVGFMQNVHVQKPKNSKQSPDFQSPQTTTTKHLTTKFCTRPRPEVLREAQIFVARHQTADGKTKFRVSNQQVAARFEAEFPDGLGQQKSVFVCLWL